MKTKSPQKRPAGIVIYIYVSIIFQFSCQENDPRTLIIGDWKSLGDTSDYVREPHFAKTGQISYSFINDSTVDTKTNYYRTFRTDEGDRAIRFVGTLTAYKIANDSLLIYEPIDSVWMGWKVKQITHDTLVLTEANGQDVTFIRDKSAIVTKPEIDQIALSSSGCYGPCPIINLIIDSTGRVVYFGERNVDSLGFYKAQVPKEMFKKITNGFRRAGIESLKQDYFAPWSDDEEISTTFSAGDRFVNSIKDYGKVGPNQLVWAYSPLMFLFQSIELQRLDTTELPFYLDLHYFRFEKENEVCELTKSESFLLWNYLRQGRKVDRPFERRFRLTYVRNYIWASNDPDDSYHIQAEKKVEKISTDRRVYYFEIKGEDPISIDIGFNFFDRNVQFMKFKEKKVYDK